jgi:acetyltransferase-like isoleucine patch superfamily enzyme
MLLFNIRQPFKSFTLKEPYGVRRMWLPKWYSRVEVGDHTFVNDDMEVCSFRSPQTVTIGKYCSIGRCRFVVDGDHNIAYASTFPFQEFGYSCTAKENKRVKAPQVVENDCWVCDDAVLYGGVHVGNGAVVAGHAIVTKDVPAYAVVAGNPARVVKYRFDEATQQRLLNSRWWDLPADFVARELAPCMHDVNAFLDVAEGYDGTANKKNG